MAGVEFKGIDELGRKFNSLERDVRDDALTSGMWAAARVFYDALKAAAPVMRGQAKSFSKLPQRAIGQLRNSITISRGRPTKDLTSQTISVGRLLVGPDKKTGFYGYFLEKGWKRSTTFSSKRIKRAATQTTHSQSGVTQYKDIPAPYPDWSKNAIVQAMGAAQKALEDQFNRKLEEILKRRS